MISLQTPTQSPTSLSLEPKVRAELIEWLASHWLENMSGRDLERFFLDIQYDYLGSYSDEELVEEIIGNMGEETFMETFSDEA